MATKLGSVAVGSSVYLNVSGTPREFLVVHQGNPDNSLYDSSCNGTWLLMKDIYEARQWNSANSNSYANSDIHAYLNGEFLGLFESNIQDQIKQVKIPYYDGDASTTVVANQTYYSGSDGLPTKIFLLSCPEVEIEADGTYYDGACLEYFRFGNSTPRIGCLNGTATSWWLRSPHNLIIGSRFTRQAWQVRYDGSYDMIAVTNSSYGIRPALICPVDLYVLDDGTISRAPPYCGYTSIGGAVTGVQANVSVGGNKDRCVRVLRTERHGEAELTVCPSPEQGGGRR